MAEAVVSIVVGRLTDLLTEESQLLHEVTDEIQQVVNKLKRMNTFLPDADSRINEPEVRKLVADVRELAYDAEHVVETFLLKALSSGRIIQWINTKKFSREIKDIEKTMSLLFVRFHDRNIKSTSESPSSSSGTLKILKRFCSYTTPEPELFVGFDGDVDLLVKHLVNESDDCYTLVSICGMGGLGKTTLARKIYNHPTIKTFFSLSGVSGLAWVSISKKWQRKQVLQRILICLVNEKKNEILTWDDDKLVENLLEEQQRKKCLIVLDDIWSTDAWDSLKAAFPAGKSVSKIMLTSRNDKVAEHANPNGYIHRPQLLSPDQSWELLWLKAFPKEEDCLSITRDDKRMEELGRKLVGYCGGLPLAIMTLGGMLVTKPSLIEWEKVYDDSLLSLKRGKGLDEVYQSQIFDLLLWSYNDLPPQLKPCFLYLGKYDENESIDAETLYQLWIAEGMVLSSDKKEGETMMHVAESYLGELVHKSMVQVKFSSVKSSIYFNSCSLHDLMRDLSISQAKAEGFFKVIDLREDHLSPSVDITRGVVVNFDEEHTNRKTEDYFGKKADQQRYQSMLLFNKFGTSCLPPVLESHIANFRLLRVFSLEVQIGLPQFSSALSRKNLGEVLGSLVYLRYLRVSDAHLLIFPSVQKLMLLETLRLDRQFDIVFPPWLSRNILSKLGRLRHLYLPSLGVENIRKNSKLRFSGLNKLETLENFDINWCEVKDLPKLISLQKLTLIKVSCYDMEEMMENLATIALSSSSCLRYLEVSISTREHGLCNDDYFPENFRRGEFPADIEQVFEQIVQKSQQMAQLSEQLLDMLRPLFWNYNFNLQELTLAGGLPELAKIFEQPPQQCLNTHFNVSQARITSLILWESHLVEDPMPVLEKIATLRNLYLHMYTFMGEEMICSATGFPNLINLSLELLPNLKKWKVEKGSMPALSFLMFLCCRELVELPEELVFLNSLQTLGLASMPLKFCDQIRKANGEQGPQFYKVAHIPSLQIVFPDLDEAEDL